MSIFAQQMDVGPELAEKWLATNVGNRRISRIIVKSYADQMRQGQWVLTHQGIAFDDCGNLKDGQHRLMAVLESQTTVPMMVHWGVDDGAFDRMDVGFKRQPGHLIATNGNIKAGAARWMSELPLLKRGHKLTTHQILQIADQFKDGLDKYAATAVLVNKKSGIAPSLHLALLAVAATTKYADRIDGWVEGVSEGAGLSKDDPRLVLRNRWAVTSRRLNASHAESAFLLTRAWNAYALGAPVAQLKWSQNYAPIPIEGAA